MINFEAMEPKSQQPDISSRADIEALVNRFYEQVKVDDVIGVIFTEVIPMNWEHHIPVIVDFWETILLDNIVYKKNAMEVHYDVNKKMPLQKEHFDRWILLFNSTIDELYSGEKATLAKTRASSIAAVMQFKMQEAGTKK
jgi:hemoglobin